MNKRIDLHTHTTASDGSLAPAELVRLAVRENLGAIAITDHDTVDGVQEGQRAGAELSLEVVPGVELSTDLRNKTVHILGYFIDVTHPELTDKLEWARSVRAQRNHKIVERFNELGIEMTYEEAAAKAGRDVVGRPHFAAVLLEKGIVSSMQEAFDIYLKRDGKAYVPKFRFTPEQSVGLILKAGGLPVLAHPGSYSWSPLELDGAVGDLCELGLAGIEVLYSEHTPSQVQIFLDIVRRRDLLPTGGSDFHGDPKPEIALGVGRGDLSVPYRWLEAMKKRIG